jgi:hypothetical protein
MKNKHGLLFGFAAVFLAALFTLAGCGGGAPSDPFAGTNWQGEAYGDSMSLGFSKDGKVTVTADGESASGTYALWYGVKIVVDDDEEMILINGDTLSLSGTEFKKTSGKAPVENTKWEATEDGEKLIIAFSKGSVSLQAGTEKMTGTYTVFPGVHIEIDGDSLDLVLSDGKLVDDLDDADIVLTKGGVSAAKPAPAGSASTPAASSVSWKKALDDYETFVDEYLVFMKKYQANPSDTALLNQYASMMQKATDSMESMEKLQEDMSAADLTQFTERYEKIAAKLSAAASQL